MVLDIFKDTALCVENKLVFVLSLAKTASPYSRFLEHQIIFTLIQGVVYISVDGQNPEPLNLKLIEKLKK